MLGRVCLCCDHVTMSVMLVLGANCCVRHGVSVLLLRDGVSYVSVRT